MKVGTEQHCSEAPAPRKPPEKGQELAGGEVGVQLGKSETALQGAETSATCRAGSVLDVSPVSPR